MTTSFDELIKKLQLMENQKECSNEHKDSDHEPPCSLSSESEIDDCDNCEHEKEYSDDCDNDDTTYSSYSDNVEEATMEYVDDGIVDDRFILLSNKDSIPSNDDYIICLTEFEYFGKEYTGIAFRKDAINEEPKDGEDKLIFIFLDYPEIVEFLLINDIDVNSSDMYDNTPLHLADNCEVVETLIKYGADVNSREEKCETPLMYAVMNNDIDKVKILLEYNAEVRLKNNNGMTALDLASQWNYNEIKDLLKAAGA